MGWITSFLGRGKQIVGRIGSGISGSVRSALDFVRGKPVSSGAATPQPPTGQTLQSPELQRALAGQGEVNTPWGTVRIDPEKIKNTVAGSIPQEWLNDVRLEKLQVLEMPNIWGRPYHYRIQFRVLEMGENARGEASASFHDKWVTVVGDSALTVDELITRGSEIALSDYSEGSPPITGAIAAVDTIAPVFYQGADTSGSGFASGG